MSGSVRRWPLAVIAAPAAVSIWSGWVGLGGFCGFGMVQPLPGVVAVHINTALTLPLGIESYAALALGAWLRSGTTGTVRTFARWSALGSLALGMLGQVSYHLLAAGHAKRAPDLVVVLVSCLPVIVLGCAVALLHLLSAAVPATGRAAESRSNLHAVTAPHAWRVSAPVLNGRAQASAPSHRNSISSRKRTRRAPVTAAEAESEFMAELAAGAVPSLRQIRARLHVGQDRAKKLRDQLEATITT